MTAPKLTPESAQALANFWRASAASCRERAEVRPDDETWASMADIYEECAGELEALRELAALLRKRP